MLGRVLGLLAALVAALGLTEAHAERRVALVIGNAHYEHASTLRNPLNDANDIAAMLKQLGFQVLVGTDLDERGFASEIDRFGRMLDGADVGLFFYAGHGLQMNDKNYLVSTKAKLENEFLIPAETVELDAIVRLMESRSRTNLVFLDACRNNPLADRLRQNLAASKRSISLGRGLARVDAGRDTLIAFAAAPGQEAADGRDRNSPFTAALLQHLPTPGVEVSVMLKQVAAEVRQETHDMQRPQQISDMSRTFYFASAAPVMAAVPQPQQTGPTIDNAVEVAHWNSARSANECESVRAYLARFPNGHFADLARLSERRLCDASRKLPTVAADPGTAKISPTLTLKPEPVLPVTAAVAATPRLIVTAVPPAAPAAETKLAALPQPAAPASSPEPAAEDDGGASRRDLVRDLQRELARVGCSTGGADGLWGSRSREALTEFNRHAGASFDPESPSQDALDAVQAHPGRVCPAESDRSRSKRETVRPERPRKQLDAERPERSRNRWERVQPRLRKPVEAGRLTGGRSRPAASLGDWHSISPLCESGFTQGGRLCCTYDPPSGPPTIICR
jgi:hypothetical protein